MADLILAHQLEKVIYIEPFAGGAAAGLRLLATGTVSHIVLNDLDFRVYSAWHSIVHETERFLERLANASVTMEKSYAFRSLVENASQDTDTFELGFATFMLNRTNRSGIVLGAAPIGGYSQTGTWRLDARLYKETLAKRIQWIGDQREKITLCCQHATRFLGESALDFRGENTFYFIDPPYVKAGSRLYFDGMVENDHRVLASQLSALGLVNWIVTYDNHPLVHDLYNGHHIGTINTRYSLHRKRTETEVVIFPMQFSKEMRQYLS